MPDKTKSLLYSEKSPLMSEWLAQAQERLIEEGVLVRDSRSPTGCDFSPAEKEKRRRGAQRLKEVLGKLPGYAKKAEEDGESFWLALYDSGHRVKNIPD